MTLYTLKIELADITPAVWRELEVPGTYTLSHLHYVIQIAMGWEDYHMHLFTINGKGYSNNLSHELKDLDESKYTIEGVLGTTCKQFFYIYDFGDSWEHIITVEKISDLDKPKNYPVCLKGELACPLEDCGGVPGYYALLEALENPEAKENEDLLEWAEDWDPEDFDIDETNKSLAKLGKRIKK
ncbi:plasmid pRiA4b ORF-3 family protein [Candidatus Dependentiae bacterium]|nr:plasmid pRiA4b ORF-3 family protein [Candidatus Dependentiae bacterium]